MLHPFFTGHESGGNELLAEKTCKQLAAAHRITGRRLSVVDGVHPLSNREDAVQTHVVHLPAHGHTVVEEVAGQLRILVHEQSITEAPSTEPPSTTWCETTLGSDGGRINNNRHGHSSCVSSTGSSGACKEPQSVQPGTPLDEKARERLGNIAATFRQADTNGGGVIDRRVLECTFQALEPEWWTKKKVRVLLRAAGLDGSSGIRYEDFIAWLFGEPTPPFEGMPGTRS